MLAVQGAIVRVKFEVQSGFTLPDVTVPLFGPEYVRYPIQPGCKGVVFPADAYLGGMSGLGGGVADLTQRANLTALVFFPIGNTGWSPVDPNAVTIYGPNGVVIRDQAATCTITLTGAGITINAGGAAVVIQNGDLHVSGAIVAGFGGGDQVSLQTHRHGTGAAAAGTTVPTPGT